MLQHQRRRGSNRILAVGASVRLPLFRWAVLVNETDVRPNGYVVLAAWAQRPNLGPDGRSSRTATRTPVVWLGDQSPMPRHQRVRRHNRREVSQDTAADGFGFRRRSPASRWCWFTQPAIATSRNCSGWAVKWRHGCQGYQRIVISVLASSCSDNRHQL